MTIPDSMDSKDAARIFMHMFVECANDASVRSVIAILESGPPGCNPRQELQHLHTWFVRLESQDQQAVRSVIHEAIHMALFDALVLIDGLTGGYPIKGQFSDFALFLQTYSDLDAMASEAAHLKTRINTKREELLHDMFKRALADRSISERDV